MIAVLSIFVIHIVHSIKIFFALSRFLSVPRSLVALLQNPRFSLFSSPPSSIEENVGADLVVNNLLAAPLSDRRSLGNVIFYEIE